MKRHWLRAGGVSIIWVDILFTLGDPESKMKVYENWDGAWNVSWWGFWVGEGWRIGSFTIIQAMQNVALWCPWSPLHPQEKDRWVEHFPN